MQKQVDIGESGGREGKGRERMIGKEGRALKNGHRLSLDWLRASNGQTCCGDSSSATVLGGTTQRRLRAQRLQRAVKYSHDS